MAAVSTSASHLQINTLEASDEDPYSPTTRDTATPEDDDKTDDRPTLSSSFSIQNVLKKEREDHIHENVFSTDKLLKNTPELDPYEREDSPRMDIEDRMSNTDSYRAEVSVDDEASCCSDDTVLSVGNEAQNFNSSAESTSKSTPNSPGTPPPHNLTSFKHIQTHLNAISQLSQSINLNQPVLLRPNPITPNLMFLNQQHMLFQNPLLSPEAKSILPNRIPLHQQTINFGLQQKQQRIVDDRRIDDRRFSLTPKSDEERRENLKFSIDNILKADFGRRITDPLTKRRSLKRPQAVKPKEAVPTPRPVDNSRVTEKSPEKAAAIDLSKNDEGSGNSTSGSTTSDGPMVWPAWVYCTRYSDRPSSGPRTRRPKKPPGEAPTNDEKRPRTAFSGPQLARLKHEFTENRYLTERRRQALAAELGLAEAQIKIWFQNKRAKIKKASGQRNPLALQLMAQGLYNHSTVPLSKEEEELEMKAREREMQREEQLG